MDTTAPIHHTSDFELIGLIAMAETIVEQGDAISTAVLHGTIRKLTAVAKEYRVVLSSARCGAE